jgi:hypothetical protein
LEHRARSYFGSNCSSCHSPEAYAHTPVSPAKHDFNYFNPAAPPDYIDKAANFKITGQDFMLIASGSTQKSFIVLRMSIRDPILQMPPIATTETDTVALRVVSEWVRSLPIAKIKDEPSQSPWKRPFVKENFLRIPLGELSREPELFDLTGSRIPLRSIGSNLFEFQSAPNPGIYSLRTEKGNFSIVVP